MTPQELAALLDLAPTTDGQPGNPQEEKLLEALHCSIADRKILSAEFSSIYLPQVLQTFLGGRYQTVMDFPIIFFSRLFHNIVNEASFLRFIRQRPSEALSYWVGLLALLARTPSEGLEGDRTYGCSASPCTWSLRIPPFLIVAKLWNDGMDRIMEQFPPGTAFQFSSSETKQQLSLLHPKLGRLLGSPDEEDIKVLSRFVAFGVEGMAFFEPGYHQLEAATCVKASATALEVIRRLIGRLTSQSASNTGGDVGSNELAFTSYAFSAVVREFDGTVVKAGKLGAEVDVAKL
ncbi:hypothetical protein BDY24DRAFT_417413 [Mrakia frigida]|uniref:uncharacterized protein n=1 Tax=Mrakia frigida TaxID=29902 RepID=UPI003FCC18F8